MGIAGEEDERVVDGVGFLRRVNAGERPEMPETVVVVGGGDVAMDACRVAKRLPGCRHVKVIYRRGPARFRPARSSSTMRSRRTSSSSTTPNRPLPRALQDRLEAGRAPRSRHSLLRHRLRRGERGAEGGRRPWRRCRRAPPTWGRPARVRTPRGCNCASRDATPRVTTRPGWCTGSASAGTRCRPPAHVPISSSAFSSPHAVIWRTRSSTRLERGFDLLVLDGTGALGREWPELRAAPDLALARETIAILRRLKKEENDRHRLVRWRALGHRRRPSSSASG